MFNINFFTCILNAVGIIYFLNCVLQDIKVWQVRKSACLPTWAQILNSHEDLNIRNQWLNEISTLIFLHLLDPQGPR